MSKNSDDIPDPATVVAGFRTELRGFLVRRVAAAEVDDLLQDCYLKISEGLAKLQDQDRIGAWVFRIARNVVVDHLRRRAHELTREDCEDPSRTDDVALDVHHSVAAFLPAFVDRLPESYAEVLRLAELQQIPHREIAERLGLSISGVKSRVQRGRAMLREKLIDCCTFEFDRRGRIVDQERRDPGNCGC